MLRFLEKRKKLLVYFPLVVYWLILLTATSIPAANMPSIEMIDKVNHLVAYFGLSVLLFLTFLFQRKYKLSLIKISLYPIIICAIYGALDEIHQMFIPGRSAEFLDWLADFGGATLAVALMVYIVHLSKYEINK